MFEAQAFEFPFVEALPKREKSRVAKAMEMLKDLSELQTKHGAIVPAVLACKILNISNQRFHQLVGEERFKTVQIHGQYYVTEDDLVAFAKLERKAGRPPKAPTLKDCLGMAIEVVKK